MPQQGHDLLVTEMHAPNEAMQSVVSTLRILEEVATRQPIGVSELARVTGMPKSSVQRYLKTLEYAGWSRVVDPVNSRWGVTTKALGIGLRASGELSLRDIAGPIIKRLSKQTDETIHFVLRDASSCIIVGRHDSTQSIRTFVELGTRAPMHATSCGIAIMAKLGEEELDELLNEKLERYTKTTVTDPSELRREIERTRKRGYAINPASWWRPHVAAIGAAISNPSGQPIAALAISIPALRYDAKREADLGKLAVAAAEDVTASSVEV